MQIVGREHHPRTVENEKLQTIVALGAKYENIAAIWIAVESRRHQRNKIVRKSTGLVETNTRRRASREIIAPDAAP
jgi:hypothetical protein